jgi:YHS domain-containing protein
MKIKDVVCDCEVDKNKAFKKEYKGKIYFFCTPTCRVAFEDNPEKYI